jgi:hypothetical protein
MTAQWCRVEPRTNAMSRCERSGALAQTSEGEIALISERRDRGDCAARPSSGTANKQGYSIDRDTQLGFRWTWCCRLQGGGPRSACRACAPAKPSPSSRAMVVRNRVGSSLAFIGPCTRGLIQPGQSKSSAVMRFCLLLLSQSLEIFQRSYKKPMDKGVCD